MLSVSNVFQDASASLAPVAQMVLILNGGTVSTEEGVVLSFLTQPRQISIHAGRTYLLALSFYSSGGFYRLGKSWDLTDGTVKANFPSSKQIPSTLIGMSLQQLITALDAQFGIQ